MRNLIAVGLCFLATSLASAPRAQAQAGNAPPAGNVAVDASRHFQRGVELYGEGDFRGALVEFKKAYTLLPRASVLYDIGQTEFQLQEYAAALQTLERFLAETGPNAVHHAEVKDSVETLRGRVGKIAVTTDLPECEVSIDDQVAGTTPLPQPILVSVGRRRVVVFCNGQPRVTRTVDVAAGDSVPLTITVGAPAPAAVAASSLGADPAEASRGVTRRTVVTAWVVTAVLAAATVGFYTGAMFESDQLGKLRRTYPLSRDQFDRTSTLTSRLALTGDILAVATLFATGVSTYLNITSHPADAERGVRVGLTWGGVQVHGAF